mmetsp:Transcript_11092/g.31898  ORF Transcript_11092/g.31898 Transcript_11092/m.31898 type:complete len:152 (-) Transcript_11092:1163-1618(-)
MVKIGRCAPFLPDDRKTLTLFELKSFLFDGGPGEWGFGVGKKLDKQEQILDITSDVTGEPHETARQSLPMHANEVGHNPDKKVTLLARPDDQDRCVNFFLFLQDEMEPKQTIEALVDYGQLYEDIRERKGYGLLNEYGNLLGHNDSLAKCS